MRNRALVTAVVLFAVGGGCAESIATSPECERWISDYRQKLAESRPVQEVVTQHHALKRYVHRQISQATHKPTLQRVAMQRDPLRPSLTPQQMVRRFQVLCGDLPPTETAQLVPPMASSPLPATPLRVTSAPDAPGISTPTTFLASGSRGPVFPGGFGPSSPSGGGTPPSGPGTPTTPPGGPGTPTTPPSGPGTPTTPPDGPGTPTTPPSGPGTPTTPPDGPGTPTTPPSGPETPTTPPDGPGTPTTPPSGPGTPTTPPDGPGTPTTPPHGPPDLPPTQPPTGPPAPPVPEPSSIALMLLGTAVGIGYGIRRLG